MIEECDKMCECGHKKIFHAISENMCLKVMKFDENPNRGNDVMCSCKEFKEKS